MTIESLKFAESSFTGQKVADLPNIPSQGGFDGAAVKARMDNIGKVLIALGNFNDLIDALLATTTGDSGAANIGSEAISGVTGATVRAQLINLKAQLDAVVLGEIPDASLTGAKLANDTITGAKIAADTITDSELGTDVKVGSLAALLTSVKTSLVNAINETVGSIALKDNIKLTFATPETASKTLALTDRYKWHQANHASVAINYTVPLHADVAWEEGDWIPIEQIGAAQAAVVAASGVTINPPTKLKVNGQGTAGVLIYKGNDIWGWYGSVKA